MREHKFRVWDKETHTMSKPFGLDGPIDYGVLIQDSDAEQDVFSLDGAETAIMQFTGLRDKNGVEIYEGDVVRHALDKEGYFYDTPEDEAIGYVVCRGHEFIIEQITNVGWGFYDPESPTFQWSELEVIGNVYENPELVKEG